MPSGTAIYLAIGETASVRAEALRVEGVLSSRAAERPDLTRVRTPSPDVNLNNLKRTRKSTFNYSEPIVTEVLSNNYIKNMSNWLAPRRHITGANRSNGVSKCQANVRREQQPKSTTT